jgi:hypothetical protein
MLMREHGLRIFAGGLVLHGDRRQRFWSKDGVEEFVKQRVPATRASRPREGIQRGKPETAGADRGERGQRIPLSPDADVPRTGRGVGGGRGTQWSASSSEASAT